MGYDSKNLNSLLAILVYSAMHCGTSAVQVGNISLGNKHLRAAFFI